MRTILKIDGYETKARTHWHSLFHNASSTLYLCSECLSWRPSADLTCLSFVIALNPGPSDGPENGLSPADPEGTVPAQGRDDVQALHPQGDHPEMHGGQHGRGPLMSQRRLPWVWWRHHQRTIKRAGVHIDSLAYMGACKIIRGLNFPNQIPSTPFVRFLRLLSLRSEQHLTVHLALLWGKRTTESVIHW